MFVATLDLRINLNPVNQSIDLTHMRYDTIKSIDLTTLQLKQLLGARE